MNKKVIKEIFSYVIVIVVALLIKEFVFTSFSHLERHIRRNRMVDTYND